MEFIQHQRERDFSFLSKTKGLAGVVPNLDFTSDVTGDHVVLARYVFGGNHVKKDQDGTFELIIQEVNLESRNP